MSMSARGRNKRSRGEAGPAVEGDVNPPSKHTKREALYDPSQSQSERRKLRSRYRDILNETGDNEAQHDLVQPGGDKLAQVLHKADKVFEQVKNTREAAMDAQVLVQISKLAAKQSRLLSKTFVELNPQAFANKVYAKLRTTEDAGESISAKSTAWAALGRIAQKYCRYTPSIQFMHGPLQMDMTKKARKVSEKIKRMDPTKATTALVGLDTEAEKAGDSDEVSRAILDFLGAHLVSNEDTDGRIPLMELLVNPHSYAQTVENLFGFAYLASTHKVNLWAGADGEDDEIKGELYTSISSNATDEAQPEEEEGKMFSKSVVFELSMDEWEEAITAYGLEESTVPHRDYSQLPAHA